MATVMAARIYQGIPATSEAALFTATVPYVITSIHASGDATGGSLSLSVVPSGGTAAAANRIAQAFPVAAAASVDVLPAGSTIAMRPGDFISGLQSAGTHVTLTITADAYGHA